METALVIDFGQRVNNGYRIPIAVVNARVERALHFGRIALLGEAVAYQVGDLVVEALG